jgi:bacterioferritin
MGENINYASPLPYPEIKVLEPNKNYAEILIDAYAGTVSELTAINQYLYHHFVVNKQDKELKDLFRNIAIIEMKHLDMLGETIKLLGTNPVYRGGNSTRGDYWNGSLVYYGNSICEQLEADLDSELKAIEYYQKSINIIKDKYIQDILNRIILDEKVHVELFKQTLIKYNCNK